MKKQKMISMKLPSGVIEDLNNLSKDDSMTSTMERILKENMSSGPRRCPYCFKRWPNEVLTKESFTTRVDQKLVQSVETKDLASRYYVAVIYKTLGYCPCCGQK